MTPSDTPALSEAATAFLNRRAKGQGLLIKGEWRTSASGQTLETLDPATGKVIGLIASAGTDDVNAAVESAVEAFKDWSETTPVKRARYLWAVADLIEQNIDELAELESLDQGKPLFVGRWAEIPGAINQLRFFAGQAMSIEGTTLQTSIDYQPQGKSVETRTVREPVGVVAAIVPWNSPIVLTVMKLAPALAAGCTVVLKPAEDTSLTALRLGELFVEAGLPAGVLNIVTGRGAEAGSALANHPKVDKLAFTGSTQTGRAILEAAKTNFKRVTLELGGKSPVIVMDDADMELTIPGVANAIFFNSGQVCVAGSRLYVQRSRYDEVVKGVCDYARSLKVGHGLAPDSQMGPLVSERQSVRVEAFINSAREAGATIQCGGERKGAFITPTVVTDVTPDMEIVREEVFGPVLVIQAFDTVEEVIAAANDSDYGLAASVWTQSLSHANTITRALRTGTVWVNCHLMYDAAQAIGGVKQSGWGRDSGRQALDSYLEWKTICTVF